MKAAERGNVSERWRGYTIDEIQYQKALSLLKLEIYLVYMNLNLNKVKIMGR